MTPKAQAKALERERRKYEREQARATLLEACQIRHEQARQEVSTPKEKEVPF
jgi:hypothetical protein